MRSEFRSNLNWCGQQIIALTGVTATLVIFTLVFNGNTNRLGILQMYNMIYILMPLLMAAILPSASKNYASTSLQFGANRKSLFYATELANGILLLVTILFTMGMNTFSTIIYQTIETDTNWNISVLEWCYLIVLTLLIWKISHRQSFLPTKDMSKRATAKVIAIVIGCILLSIGSLICIRIGLLSMLPISASTLFLISGLIFTIFGVIIILLQRSNYRLFMQMEV